MSDEFLKDFAIEQMRLQRHEFMNSLQVIYGYIQINRPQEVVNYIKGINKKMAVLSQLFNLECSNFALFMQDLIIQCNKYGVDVDFNAEIEYISCEVFSKNIVEKSKLFNTIKDIIVNETKNKDNKVFIDLIEENNAIRMIFSNNNEIYFNDYSTSKSSIIIDDKEHGHKIVYYKSNDDFIIIFDILSMK